MSLPSRMRAWILLPVAKVRWAGALDAQQSGDWERVVKEIRGMHWAGWETDESLLMLGVAFAHLGRHADAIDPLERIRKTLRPAEAEQARWLNLATSYHHVGRHHEALQLLPPENEIPIEFPDFADSASQLRAAIESSISGGSRES